MSEEEKEAIKDLKKMCIEVLRDGNLINYLVDIVLNLIEKLQKEIEELENKRKTTMEVIGANYIHKDKIRAFIKEETKEGTYDFETISAKRLKKFLED